MPAEGQIETGPNGQKAIFQGGRWVLMPSASAPSRAPGGIGGVYVPKAVDPSQLPKSAAELEGLRLRNSQESQVLDANVIRAKAEAAKAKAEAEALVPATAPGDTTKTGAAYLATLPGPMQNQIRAYATGRLMLPQGAALRSPQVRELQAAALQYDPSLDAAGVAARFKLRQSIAAGAEGKQLTALNTTLGHAGQLAGQVSGTAGHAIPLIGRGVNAVVNAYEKSSGDPGITNYQDTQGKLAEELTRFYRQGAGAESDVQRAIGNLSENASTSQKMGGLKNTVELLTSPIDAMYQRYAAVMGPGFTMNDMLDDHSKAVLQQFAPDYAARNGIKVGQHSEYLLPNVMVGSGGDQGPPTVGGGTPPPSGPSGPTGGPPGSIGGPGGATPWQQQESGVTAATGASKRVFDPKTAAGIDSLIRAGRPIEEARAFAAQAGYDPQTLKPNEYLPAVAYAKAHPEYKGGFANPERDVATTGRERFSASPQGAFIGGARSALTGGFDDELAGAGAALTGGDYTQARDAFEANKNIVAENQPGANLAGNIGGGVLGTVLGEAALARAIPGAMGVIATRLGKYGPAAGDTAYGSAYGAGSDNQDRLGGAVGGGLSAVAGGALARGATRGLANVISPPAGEFGPAYAQGVFPTIGQRFARSGPIGKAINVTEQAMQSMPGLGALVAAARDGSRDAAQVGAFNHSLGDLKPFDQVLGETISSLPPGTGPGTDAHAFTKSAFDKAYPTARGGMQFVPDQPYMADLSQFMGRLNNGSLNDQQAAQVGKFIDNAVGSRLRASGGALPGHVYSQAGTELGDQAAAWAKDGTTQPMANALNDYTAIFDQAARRNSDPNAVALLDAADNGYAKYVRVRNASARLGGDPGTFTMKNLDRAVQQEAGGVKSGPYLNGKALMQDYSTAVQPLGDTLSNSGTGERLLTNKLFMGEQGATGAAGLAAGGLGAIAAHPGALAPFALYAPGMNTIATRAIAPRAATLPPNVAAILENMALQVQQRAPIAGRLAVPAAAAWGVGQ